MSDVSQYILGNDISKTMQPVSTGFSPLSQALDPNSSASQPLYQSPYSFPVGSSGNSATIYNPYSKDSASLSFHMVNNVTSPHLGSGMLGSPQSYPIHLSPHSTPVMNYGHSNITSQPQQQVFPSSAPYSGCMPLHSDQGATEQYLIPASSPVVPRFPTMHPKSNGAPPGQGYMVHGNATSMRPPFSAPLMTGVSAEQKALGVSSSPLSTRTASEIEAHEPASRKKRRACGHCGPCQRKENCGTCLNCLNRAKGKQICIYRKCEVLKKKPGSAPYTSTELNTEIKQEKRKDITDFQMPDVKRNKIESATVNIPPAGLVHPVLHPNFPEFGDMNRSGVVQATVSQQILPAQQIPTLGNHDGYYTNPPQTVYPPGSSTIPVEATPVSSEETEYMNQALPPVEFNTHTPVVPSSMDVNSLSDSSTASRRTSFQIQAVANHSSQLQGPQQLPASQQSFRGEWNSAVNEKPLPMQGSEQPSFLRELQSVQLATNLPLEANTSSGGDQHHQEFPNQFMTNPNDLDSSRLFHSQSNPPHVASANSNSRTTSASYSGIQNNHLQSTEQTLTMEKMSFFANQKKTCMDANQNNSNTVNNMVADTGQLNMYQPRIVPYPPENVPYNVAPNSNISQGLYSHPNGNYSVNSIAYPATSNPVSIPFENNQMYVENSHMASLQSRQATLHTQNFNQSEVSKAYTNLNAPLGYSYPVSELQQAKAIYPGSVYTKNDTYNTNLVYAQHGNENSIKSAGQFDPLNNFKHMDHNDGIPSKVEAQLLPNVHEMNFQNSPMQNSRSRFSGILTKMETTPVSSTSTANVLPLPILQNSSNSDLQTGETVYNTSIEAYRPWHEPQDSNTRTIACYTHPTHTAWPALQNPSVPVPASVASNHFLAKHGSSLNKNSSSITSTSNSFYSPDSCLPRNESLYTVVESSTSFTAAKLSKHNNHFDSPSVSSISKSSPERIESAKTVFKETMNSVLGPISSVIDINPTSSNSDACMSKKSCSDRSLMNVVAQNAVKQGLATSPNDTQSTISPSESGYDSTELSSLVSENAPLNNLTSFNPDVKISTLATTTTTQSPKNLYAALMEFKKAPENASLLEVTQPVTGDTSSLSLFSIKAASLSDIHKKTDAIRAIMESSEKSDLPGSTSHIITNARSILKLPSQQELESTLPTTTNTVLASTYSSDSVSSLQLICTREKTVDDDAIQPTSFLQNLSETNLNTSEDINFNNYDNMGVSHNEAFPVPQDADEKLFEKDKPDKRIAMLCGGDFNDASVVSSKITCKIKESSDCLSQTNHLMSLLESDNVTCDTAVDAELKQHTPSLSSIYDNPMYTPPLTPHTMSFTIETSSNTVFTPTPLSRTACKTSLSPLQISQRFSAPIPTLGGNVTKSSTNETANKKTIFPQCECQGAFLKDKAPYYTHLGAASTVTDLRQIFEKRTGYSGKAIRIEKVVSTAEEGETSDGCPISKWVIRRSTEKEKVLVVCRQRPGHRCRTAVIAIAIMLWDGIDRGEADTAYDICKSLIPKHAVATKRGCARNAEKTCACQGYEAGTGGASYSFGCSWSVFENGCKFARSKNPKKFKLNGTKDFKAKDVLTNFFQEMATKISPIYKQAAPDAYQNQTEHEQDGYECRLGNNSQSGKPFSGITCCMDFCAHSHKDRNNMENGTTVVLTLTKPENRLIGVKPAEEQFHVLPLHRLDLKGEDGSLRDIEQKIKHNSVEIVTGFPSHFQFHCKQPVASSKKRKGKMKNGIELASPVKKKRKSRKGLQSIPNRKTLCPCSNLVDKTRHRKKFLHGSKSKRFPRGCHPLLINDEHDPKASASDVNDGFSFLKLHTNSKNDCMINLTPPTTPIENQLQSSDPASLSPQSTCNSVLTEVPGSAPIHSESNFLKIETEASDSQTLPAVSPDGTFCGLKSKMKTDSFLSHSSPPRTICLKSIGNKQKSSNELEHLESSQALRTPDAHHHQTAADCTWRNREEETLGFKYESFCDSNYSIIDPNIGGVAMATTHGSILIECAKRELHATTPLPRPDRFNPSRISLVFYQHKHLNLRNHGAAEYEMKNAKRVQRKDKKRKHEEQLKLATVQEDSFTILKQLDSTVLHSMSAWHDPSSCV